MNVCVCVCIVYLCMCAACMYVCMHVFMKVYMFMCITPSSLPVTSQAFIDLFRPRLTVSPKYLQVIFVHSVCNSALFFAFCCCSFFLQVVANFICIFLVSIHLFLLSNLPKFLHFCCGQTVKYSAVLKNFISIDVNRFLSFSEVQNFASVQKNGESQCIIHCYS